MVDVGGTYLVDAVDLLLAVLLDDHFLELDQRIQGFLHLSGAANTHR